MKEYKTNDGRTVILTDSEVKVIRAVKKFVKNGFW